MIRKLNGASQKGKKGFLKRGEDATRSRRW